MLELTNADARNMRRLLLVAEQHCRERAAEQSYRATACKTIGESLLSEYHVRRAEDALSVADLLAGLAGALSPAEDVRWRLNTRVPTVELRVPVELASDPPDGYAALELDGRPNPQGRNLPDRERLVAGLTVAAPAPLPGGSQ